MFHDIFPCPWASSQESFKTLYNNTHPDDYEQKGQRICKRALKTDDVQEVVLKVVIQPRLKERYMVHLQSRRRNRKLTMMHDAINNRKS